VARPPTDPLFLGRLADAMRRLKEPAKAIKLLQQAVALDPSSRPLQLQLAEAFYAAGRYGEAERHFRAVLK
jgi:predicted Zn-dependent protease